MCLPRRVDTKAALWRGTITVLITVHNEAREIKDKIVNVLDSSYQSELIEILVASDGSNDGTDELVRTYGDARVKLFRPTSRNGKTATQNEAIPHAYGEVLVFTDAATRFDRNFLDEIALLFSDPQIGAVDGHLQFVTERGNALSHSQGFYWTYELRLRELESKLGISCVGSGACLALRKSLFREMDTSIGEDCILPLDVIACGYQVVHASRALAYDRMDSTPEKEFRTRVRMTARNWRGTWSRPKLLNPLFYPGYAFALWSHKVLRWLSPFFLIALLLSAIAAGISGGSWYWLFIIIPGGIVSGVVIGWSMQKMGIHIFGVPGLYNFGIANLGFMVGVLKAIFGKPILTYR